MNFWKQLAIITLRKVNQVHFSQMPIRYIIKINISKRKFVIKLKIKKLKIKIKIKNE